MYTKRIWKASMHNTQEFIDFYQLLNEPENASTSRLRARMTELFAEAQANRDHRNLQTRRRYNDLLMLLPRCRSILRDERKRTKYDDYIMQMRTGQAEESFHSFIHRLIADKEIVVQTDAERMLAIGTKPLATPHETTSARNTDQADTAGRSVDDTKFASWPTQQEMRDEALETSMTELERDAELHVALMIRMASAGAAAVFF